MREEARRLGFDLFGVTSAAPLAGATFLARCIDSGFAGQMGYLERSPERRADPGQLVPGARSVVCVGLHYAPPDGESAEPRRDGDGPHGRIARYARGDDYHDLVKGTLAQLWEHMRPLAGGDAQGRYAVDTAPVLERELAARAGLGWWGKNTCLIHRGAGSYFFRGEVISTIDLQEDAPAVDHCGTCTRCLEACPTQAFPEPYVLDARRCISYLTIELKGAIPEPLRDGMGDWILGCDVCQEVCPWNRRGATTAQPGLRPRPGLDPVDLVELIGMDRDAFNERFRRSAAKRPKRRGMLRNAAVALGNAGRRQVVPALARALRDEEEPLVRAHIAWALGKLGGADARAALRQARAREGDAQVLQEVEAALVRLDG